MMICAALVTALLAAPSSRGRDIPPLRSQAGSSADEQAVHDLVFELVRALGRGHGAEVARLFMPQGIAMPPDHSPIQGRNAIADEIDQRQRVNGRSLHRSALETRVQARSGFEIGMFRVGETRSDGVQTLDSGKYVLIFQKTSQGRWLIAYAIWNWDPQAPQ